MCMASIPVTFLVLALIIPVLVAAVGVGVGEPGRLLRTACDMETCSLSVIDYSVQHLCISHQEIDHYQRLTPRGGSILS